MKTPLTEEQQILQDEQEAVYLEGQILALRWMRQRAHDYTPSQKNADLLRLWIAAEQGWCAHRGQSRRCVSSDAKSPGDGSVVINNGGNPKRSFAAVGKAPQSCRH